jgi:hypothetical protein
LTIQQIFWNKKEFRNMQTFTLNRLSEMLEIDRGTMQRALRNTPPDAESGKRQSYKISTAAKALERHRRAVGTSNGGGDHGRRSLIDEEEATFAELDRQFERLEAEPDIEKRRALSLKMQVGKTINTLEELFQATNEQDDFGAILQIATDKMIGAARSKLIDRLDLWDAVDDLNAERRTKEEAEYQAKRAKEDPEHRAAK